MVPNRPTVKLLIVDHSPASREKLKLLFDSRPDISVVGEAGTAQKAMKLLGEASPTAVLLDCDLPQPGSFALVKEMMTIHRVPIVMLTKQGRIVPHALEAQALEAGAVALAGLSLEGMTGDKTGQDLLVKTVRTMSEVKVVRRRSPRTEPARPGGPVISTPSLRPARTDEPITNTLDLSEPPGNYALLAIGASTGGPQVLEAILRGLSKRLTVPVVIVQHLSEGFQNNLVQWLSDSTGVQIRIGQHGTPMVPGIVYFAPDNKHMQVNGSGHLVMNSGPPENGSRPSVSALFRSVAEHYGPRAIGVLLTGMGRDGAKELKLMRERGALTIAQDEETSAVHGMPGEAIKLKGARYVLPPQRIVSVVEHHLPASSVNRREAVSCS
jgi:two-component system chemotaxis response regulator CheB